MADTEVENVLREIRERVRAEAGERAPLVTRANLEHDGGDEVHDARAAGESAPSALARIEANLATTERTWNRLPPLVSNRTGWLARLELWVKRKIKRALHWFTWEQVNFNSSVHHSLRDTVAALADYDRRLREHDRQLAESRADSSATRDELSAARAETSEMRAEINERRAEISAARAEISAARAEAATTRAKVEAAGAELASLRQSNSELTSRLESEDADADARRAELEERLAATGARLETEVARFHDALAAAIAQLRDEERSLADSLVQLRDEQRTLAADATAARQEQIDGLRRELDERAEQLRDELRVSFRQLSLEAGEAAVMHDRARRHIEARLEEVEKEVLRTEG